MSDRTCPGYGCSSPLDNEYLCRRCQHRAERILGDLPALTRELRTTVTRQDRVATGRRGMGAEQPLPVNVSASDRGRQVLELLFEWADFVAAAYGVKGLPVFARHIPLEALVPQAVSVLLARSDWLRFNEQGPDLASAVWSVQQGLRRIVDCAEERLYAGPCYAELDGTGKCGLSLYRRWGADVIVCDGYRPDTPGPFQGCGASHAAVDRHAFLVASVEEHVLPLKLVWESLYVLVPGCDVPWRTALQWTKERRTRDATGPRVRIRVTPPLLTPAAVDWRGRPLYRGEDILRLAQDKKPRRGRRRVTRPQIA